MAAAREHLYAQLAPREWAAAAGDLSAAVAADLDVWASAHHGAAGRRPGCGGSAREGQPAPDRSKSLFLYFVLDRRKANLALARHQLKLVEQDLGA